MGNMFLERLEESYGNNCLDGNKVDLDTFGWGTMLSMTLTMLFRTLTITVP